MTKLAAIENKISAVQKYVAVLRSFRVTGSRELEENLERRGAVERYLYLVAQTSIDIAEQIISLRGFRKPATLAEAFEILSEQEILSGELSSRLVRMAGFRNILAHDYEKVDYMRVFEILEHGLYDIEEFVKAVQAYLRL